MEIKLNPSDWPYHHFLWHNMETKENPNVFEFERVIFGVNSSPFLVQFVIQEHAGNIDVYLTLMYFATK